MANEKEILLKTQLLIVWNFAETKKNRNISSTMANEWRMYLKKKQTAEKNQLAAYTT